MLTISGLSKTYPNDVKALDNVSLSIPAGMFGLLGPNGAGKSTLMRTIATLQEPDSGSIQLDDIDALKDKTALLFAVGSSLSPGRFSHGIPNAVNNTIIHCNIDELHVNKVYPTAQALIGEPKLIIVDEPTAGLDPAERRRFQNLLAKIGEDVVVILSTHIVDDVSDLCPRMAIMGEGRILIEGDPQSLTQALNGKLWSKVIPTEQVATLPKSLPLVSTRMVAGKTEIRVVSAPQPEGEMTLASPTLEDVYFATLRQHNLQAELD